MGGIADSIRGMPGYVDPGRLADLPGDLIGAGQDGLTYTPEGAALIDPTTGKQINNAYGSARDALGQQQAFLQALQAQGGIQNQSNVFNQLQGVANGTGPNPAAAALAQATQANVANQAALMAGQRGASQNAGLIARQAAMQGGNLQQQSAGQAATMQANQSLGALNTMGTISGQQVANQANATMGYNQAAQSEQQNLLNARAQYNNAQVGNQSNLNNNNTTLAGQRAGIIGGLLQGGASAMMAAGGGEVVRMAEGGETPSATASGPQSFVGQLLFGMTPSAATVAPIEDYGSGTSAAQAAPAKGAPSAAAAQGAAAGAAASGGSSMAAGMTPAAAGSTSALAAAPMMAANGAVVSTEKLGKKPVPGKAAVKGNSYANDKVKALLSPGEIVLPRSVTTAKDAPRAAAEFVQAILARKGIK